MRAQAIFRLSKLLKLLAGEPGFEPGLAESESAGLPLTYSPVVQQVARGFYGENRQRSISDFNLLQDFSFCGNIGVFFRTEKSSFREVGEAFSSLSLTAGRILLTHRE